MDNVLQTSAGVGVTSLALAIGLATYVALAPRPPRVPIARRRPVDDVTDSAFSRGAMRATEAVDSLLSKRTVERSFLAEAGVKLRLQELAIILTIFTVVLGTISFVISGPALTVVTTLLVPLIARVMLGIMRARRRARFGEQLDDALQLIASSLRAGHSLLHSLDSVAREAEMPMSEEFARIINETRVGRDLPAAMVETAERMSSEDFKWVTQAVSINRDVGGNLADVLESVGRTIRERAEIRRQVKALAAEGKLSAYILMALPFVIGGVVSIINPGYMDAFTDSLMGYAMLIAGAVLLLVGGFWLRKVIDVKF
jgi:tight adherence protein B